MTNNVYTVLGDVKDFLLDGPFTNTVTFGDIEDVDFSKNTTFPLAHLNIDNITISGQTMAVEIKLLVMDVVDKNSNEVDEYDIFYGNDNTQDILNSQASVLQRLYTEISRGDLSQAPFELEDDQLSAEPFKDRFKNTLAGWASTIRLIMPEGTSLSGTNSGC